MVTAFLGSGFLITCSGVTFELCPHALQRLNLAAGPTQPRHPPRKLYQALQSTHAKSPDPSQYHSPPVTSPSDFSTSQLHLSPRFTVLVQTSPRMPLRLERCALPLGLCTCHSSAECTSSNFPPRPTRSYPTSTFLMRSLLPKGCSP